jgi:hypothetical protein
MQERIAKELYEGFTGLPWPPDDTESRYTREKCMAHAAAILALPVEGCGEVEYPVSEMGRDGILHWDTKMRPLTLG